MAKNIHLSKSFTKYQNCQNGNQLVRKKIEICSVNQSILQQARSSPIKDFESAVEIICASYQQLDAIVTHKHDDFAEPSANFWVWSMQASRTRAKLENQLQAKAFI